MVETGRLFSMERSTVRSNEKIEFNDGFALHNFAIIFFQPQRIKRNKYISLISPKKSAEETIISSKDTQRYTGVHQNRFD